MAAPAGAPPAAPPQPGAPPAAPPPGTQPGSAKINQNVPSVDQYGRFTSGPYAGLTQEQASQKVSDALETHGGYSFQPGDYRVDFADGSITILKTPTNGNYGNLTPGMKVDQSGNEFMPDGSPVIDPQTGKQAQTMFGVNGQKTTAMTTAEANTPAMTNLMEGNVGDATSKALADIKSALGIGGAGVGGSVDTGAADAETSRANNLADALGVQANTAGAQADTDRAAGSQTRDQQEQSIQQLQDAASGKTASPAELQLKQQANIDAARQYGLAAALQGNNPAAALRQASLGAATVAGTTNENAAINRATETANARNSLATALGNVRTADQGAVNTDASQQANLNNAQTTSQGQGVTSTGQKLTAETEQAKADAIKQGALLSAAGSAGAALLSDKRAKENTRTANLADALGKNVHGVTFTYKPDEEEGAPGPQFGLLAQELEKVIPSVVRADASGMKRVATAPLTMANTATLAELARRIDALESKGGKKKAA